MYLDSCILVKLLTREPDSEFFDAELRGKPLASSELAYPEVCSALLAKERAGRLAPADRLRAWKQFLAWIESEEVVLLRLDQAVLRKATRQLEQCHPAVALRTLDAIHLATADLTTESPLCSTDARLRDAAKMLKLPVFPED
jgi:predicted nucleic acid-binding protein